MQVLTGHSEIKSMITYTDIQKAASEKEAKCDDFLEKYRVMIADFLKAYEESLQLPNNGKYRHDGIEKNIVTLGLKENDEFKFRPAYAMDFDRDYTIPFYIKTVVDVSDPVPPWVALKCVISRRDDRDWIEIGSGSDKKLCRIMLGDTPDKYTEATEALKSALIHAIVSENPF